MSSTGTATGSTAPVAAPAVPAPAGGEGTPGLRERMRQTVRDELSTIAMQLFIDRGFDTTTVDEIAAAAGVSRSTFFRHFAKKEDVILARLEARAEVLHAAALARPTSEPPLIVARAALIPLVESFSADRTRSIAIGRLVATTPSLRVRELHKYLYWRAALAAALGQRLGVDPETDMRVSVVASVAVNALDIAVRAWRSSESGTSLAVTVDEAFAGLAAEFAAVGTWPPATPESARALPDHPPSTDQKNP